MFALQPKQKLPNSVRLMSAPMRQAGMVAAFGTTGKQLESQPHQLCRHVALAMWPLLFFLQKLDVHFKTAAIQL